MRAVVCHQQQLEVADLSEPHPAKGQLVLQVLRCGICGSDLHARRHAEEIHSAAAVTGYADAMRPEDRVVFGHEFVGEVVDGSRGGLRAGDRVVSVPMRRDGGHAQMTGLSPRAPGAYAERVIVEASLSIRVPNGLSDDIAALTEPMAVALHAVRRSGVRARDVAVVVGCGPVGLAVISMLKAAGVRTVVASDFSARRRELARACGADVVVDPDAADLWSSYDSRRYFTSAQKLLDFAVDSMDRLRAVPFLPWARVMHAAEIVGAAPRGPVVFECVGVPGVIDQIVTGAPLQTRVVVIGVTMEPDRIRPSIAINKEIELRFVFAYTPRDFHDALGMLADGKVDGTPFVTGHVGLDGVAGAFDVLGRADEHAKIMVDPSLTGTVIS